MKQMLKQKQQIAFERALALLKDSLAESGYDTSYKIHKQCRDKFPFHHYIFSRQPNENLKRSQMIKSIAESFSQRNFKSSIIHNKNGFRPFSSDEYSYRTEKDQMANDLRFLKNIDPKSFVFLIFQPLGQQFKVSVLNIHGCIFYQIVRLNNLKHSTVLATVKRKLKAQSFLFIYSKVEDQRQEGIHQILKKLEISFVFFRPFSDTRQREQRQQNQEDKSNFVPNFQIRKRGNKAQKAQKSIKVQKTSTYEIARFNCQRLNFNNEQVIQICRDYLEIVLKRNNGIAQYVKTLSVAIQKKPNYVLRLSAMVLNYNYCHYFDNRNPGNYFKQNLMIPRISQQLYDLAKQQLQKQMSCEKDIKNHFAQLLERCKFCQYCKLQNLPHKKKSKYRCQGCSIQLGQDVPLCVLHFRDFHENKQAYLDRMRKRRKQRGRKTKHSSNRYVRYEQFSEQSQQQRKQSYSDGSSFNQNVKIEECMQLEEGNQLFDHQNDLQEIDNQINQMIQVLERLINLDSKNRQSNRQLVSNFMDQTLQKLEIREQQIKSYMIFPEQ